VRIQNIFENINKFSTDDSLTKKASLNAFRVVLDYAARLIVGFFITPLLVIGLGKYLFGTWQVLNRLMGYISPSSGRPTQALKWTLARDQSSTDYEQKQKYLGSAFIVWIVFLPLMIILGGCLVWMLPNWLKTPPEHFWQVRVCIGILVANLVMYGLAEIPSSVLQGENLGYKRMGLQTATVLLGGGLIWLAMRLETGIVGVATALLITTSLTGVVFLNITRKYAKWLKLVFPPFQQTRQFFGLSFWFLGWNLVRNLMMASDVVILGFLVSVEAVTDYSLTKYAPETLISIIALMNFGITPGLGGIIGSGQLKKAADVRREMMTLTWLVTTALGATILFWNRSFLNLWVGPGHYIGPVAAFLVILVVTQFVLIRCDAGIIDLSLNLRRKVLMGFLSAAAAIVVSSLLVGYFKLGVIGLCLGLIVGRMLLSLGYPSIVGRFLGVSISSQLRSSIRPALVTILLYSIASWMESYINLDIKSDLMRWINLIGGAGITAGVFLVVTFYLGLSEIQREKIFRRLRALNLSGVP
jgi:O-antigen/teichoic acid export membrane protein